MAQASLVIASLALLCLFPCLIAEAKPSALFVFGDSYADTGNHDPSDPAVYRPWRTPYGETWPQQPSGRFSDGRLLTDFFASFLGIRMPVPYRVLRTSTPQQTDAGVNFAFGGSGVFSTFGPQYPNISVQITQFRETIQRGLFSEKLLRSSFVLLVVAGYDYTLYSAQHPNNEGVMEFIPKVVAQMAADLQALHDLGLRRFAVTNLEPFGCLPGVTSKSNYTECGETENGRSRLHNMLLAERIAGLKNQLKEAEFMELDLDGAFKAVLQVAQKEGQPNLQWRPCCESFSSQTYCGQKDLHGKPLYTLCSSPSRSFFWDSFHPTQAGWQAICKPLFAS